MLVDFGSGLAMDGVDDNPEVYQLPVNPKETTICTIFYTISPVVIPEQKACTSECCC